MLFLALRKIMSEACEYTGQQTRECNTATSIIVKNTATFFAASEFRKAANLETVEFESGSQMISFNEEAFSQCPKLKSVEIPPSLETIGASCFKGCPLLGPSIDIPASLKTIGTSAFQTCTSLQFVNWNINCQVKSLPSYCFENSGLVEAQIFPSLQQVVMSTFTSPTLERFVILGTSTSFSVIDGVLFDASGTDLTKFPGTKQAPYYVPASTKRILNGAFRQTTITETDISLATNLETIVGGAFKYSNIERFVYPPACKVTEILTQTFAGCKKLTSVTLSASIISIEHSAFTENTPLEELILHESNPFYTKDGIVYNEDGTEIIFCMAGFKADSVTVECSVKVVYQAAFFGCQIKTVTFQCPLESLGTSAFRSAKTTQLILHPDSTLDSIPESCFTSSSITAFVFPKSIQYVHGMAFTNSKMSSFDVPVDHPYLSAQKGIIYNKAGTDLMAVPPGLAGSISIPACVTTIREGAFYNSKITELHFDAGSQLMEIQKSAFQSCKSLVLLAFDKSCPLTTLGSGVFETSAIEEIVLPDGVTAIQTNAFSGCEGLRTVHMPLNLIEIQQEAFKNCENLAEIIFPPDCAIETIGKRAFVSTPSLSTISLPGNVNSIAADAFSEQVIRVIVTGSTAPAVMRAVEAIPFIKEIVVRCGKEYVVPDKLVENNVKLSYWCTTIRKRWDRCSFVQMILLLL